MTLLADNYKSPACDSGRGNLNVDVIEYTFTGAESAGAQVKLRKMSEFNTYVRVKILASEAFEAGSTIDVGYISSESGGTDDVDAFGDALNLVTTQSFDGVTAPVAIDEAHELVLVINANDAGNAGNKITIIAEFVNVSS